tara:strand:+ start:710 stop:1414 length:705 start_codon:yes stop_codon:yes gene_type:complete
MFKRFLDIIISSIGLIFLIPIILPIIIVIWWEDKKTPFYIPLRVGKNNKMFKMIKLRSMYVDADKSKVNSTSDNDLRITSIGKKIRKYKLDELVQLWNVLLGDMSLVGPRPNIKSETDLYTDVEKDLLLVKPGITDFSSIVFTDEGKILEDKKDPDLAYNQLIRPWKSRLSLIYIKNQSNLLDLQIIIFTLIAFISKRKALQLINKKLINLGADIHTIKTSLRENELSPHTPPD